MGKKLRGYNIISLKDMLDAFMEKHSGDNISAEKEVTEILETFSCHHNIDVDDFLHKKAIEFTKQGLAATHLVVTSYNDEVIILGYFTIAMKTFELERNALSKRLRKRVIRFGSYYNELKKYVITAPLIGQIGKNNNGNGNTSMPGDELLEIACEFVRSGFAIWGGKVVYLDCEDVPSLISFYERNGFIVFGKRIREEIELEKIKTPYLIQLLKLLK